MELKTKERKTERAFPALRVIFIVSICFLLILGLYFLVSALCDPSLTLPDPYGLPKMVSL